ncbi:MAG TPA: response regulator transcription factor [Gemmataceae bacterium]|nr:response regulator transcription factor [Gemmataceae bacterium]
MKILIADDDDVSRLALGAALAKRGHEVVAAVNGTEAWQAFQGADVPRLAILDWLMPEIDGLEVCRRLRSLPDLKTVYLILLTSRGSKEYVVEGLRAGANDYVTKPFYPEELAARVNVGVQVVELQLELARRVEELEAALQQVKQLQGLLPICAYCKRIRDDQNYWHEVEGYIGTHADVRFSHGICPACWTSVVKPEFENIGLRVEQ